MYNEELIFYVAEIDGTITTISVNSLPLSRIEFRRAMQSEMVDYAIAMGFTRNHVRQVVKKQIDEFSCSFQTSDALVSALIMSQEDLIDLNDEGDNNRDRPSTSSREGNC